MTENESNVITEEEKLINETQKPYLKRIASLDFQRGIAIWMMVFLHVRWFGYYI